MALTLRHWLGAAILGCAAIAVTYLPPSHEPRWFRRAGGFRNTPEERMRSIARSRVTEAHETLIVFRNRDEVLDWLNDIPAGNAEPNVFLDPELPESWHAPIRAAVEAHWNAIQPTKSDVRFAFAVLVDTAGARAGLPRQRVSAWRLRSMLPAATDGRTCITMVRFDRAQFVRPGSPLHPVFAPLSPEQYVGPCAWYAAFGIPGTAVERWFTEHGYIFAYDNLWTEAATAERPELAEFPFFGPWSRIPVADIPCATGSEAGCATFLTDPPDWTSYWWARSAIIAPGITRPTFDGGSTRLDGAANSLLADVIREKGRDRFEQFWKSDLDLPVAFEQAMGEPLGQWTARWATARLRLPPPGPAPRLASSVFGLTLATLVIAACAWVSTRRQVR